MDQPSEASAVTDDRTLAERVEVLEAVVERQAATIEDQQERLDELEGGIDGTTGDATVSRRTALKAGGLAGLLALGSGVASADPQGQVGTADDPIATLYAEELDGGITGGEPLSSLVGGPLAVEGGELSLALGPVLDVADGELRIGPTLHAPGDVDEVLDGMERDADGSYVITDVHELQAMNADLGGNYRLGTDVDASATALWNGGSGFVPIGGSSAGFTGTLDGAGHSVDGLTVDRAGTSGVGLFGAIEPGADVTGVRVTNVDVTGDALVGGLVGENDGTVGESSASGTVSASTGIAGGLVGVNSGSLADSYATASVAGPGTVGGVAGRNFGVAETSYAAGSVSGTTQGGLVGENNDVVRNAYWDTAATGRAVAVGSNFGSTTDLTGLTTAEMQGSAAASTMSALDFGTVWTTRSDDYPTLQVFEE